MTEEETEVLAPLVVDAAEAVLWEHQADLVVVGFGGAGAAAAVQASQDGLEVLALDQAEGGGATQASGGVIYAGGGTSIQQAMGEQDSPENMYAYLKLETQNVVQDETLRRFCQGSANDLEWLRQHGVKFSGPVWKQKTSYPPVKYFLYHPDNSLLPPYAAVSRPAARGHRGVMTKGKSAVNLGGSIYLPLRRAALANGVRLDCKTEARQMVVDRQGRVLGLRALQLPPGADYAAHSKYLGYAERLQKFYPFFLPGATRVHRLAKKYLARAAEIENTRRVWVNYRARRGVCLSTGGFIFNRAMVNTYCPGFAAGFPLGTAGDDGSGIRLGQSLGASLKLMERGTAWRFINPPIAWSQGIVVDARGRRFVNESCYGATIGDAMVEVAGGRAWLILDSQLVRDAWRQSMPGKVLPFQWQLAAINMLFGKVKAKTVEDMCATFGFDKQVMQNTLAETAQLARGELEDPFRKASQDQRELKPPYHVIDVSLGARLLPCMVLTMGGLAVNERTGQVLASGDKVIPGLYAAGRTAVGIPSKLYLSGLSIADCIFSGRRAARHMAGLGSGDGTGDSPGDSPH